MARLKKLDNKNKKDQEEIARLFGQAPEWVNFIGFDSDGHQSWYGEKPQLSGSGIWIFSRVYNNNYEEFPFDGLHFENQTYYSCLIERPRFESKGASHPNLAGFAQNNDEESITAYQVVMDIFSGLRNWRLTRQNKAAKEAASEVERLINCGK